MLRKLKQNSQRESRFTAKCDCPTFTTCTIHIYWYVSIYFFCLLNRYVKHLITVIWKLHILSNIFEAINIPSYFFWRPIRFLLCYMYTAPATDCWIQAGTIQDRWIFAWFHFTQVWDLKHRECDSKKYYDKASVLHHSSENHAVPKIY